MAHEYSIDEIQKGIGICIGVLLKNDSFLVQERVSERSVSHKLAEYLQVQFPDWNVDCEYNRKGLDPKTLDAIHECDEQKKTDRIIPDIIVHRRNTNDNLLVVEIKNQGDDPCDLRKLVLFTSPTGGFRYKLGLFLKFDEPMNPSLAWFKTGERVRTVETKPKHQ